MSTERRTETTIPPLNGTKTHPLTDHAKGVLETLTARPLLKHLVNPGVVNRLRREGLADVTGKELVITDAGRALVREFIQ